MAPSPRWIPAYVGVGSNLDDPLAQVRRATQAIANLPTTRLLATSPWYSNPPMGPKSQPDYINGVVGVLTQLNPRQFLVGLKALELQLGREPAAQRWGPRLIDLDLLLHGVSQVDAPGLNLPHPGIGDRSFVIKPLLDIAPDINVPGLGRLRESVKVSTFTDLEPVGT
jgi:2-amino-4-hydroxy-6-hydroxymethyldihydropteridine diphosphokinase